MKNFIQRETLNFTGLRPRGLLPVPGGDAFWRSIRRWRASRCRREIPYAAPAMATRPSRPPVRSAPPPASSCAAAVVRETVEARSGSRASSCCASAAAPSTASCATSTPRCRISRTGRCTCGSTSNGSTPTRRRLQRRRRSRHRCARIVHEVFQAFESGSIQQVIYQMGTSMLAEIPSIAEVHLEAKNRTWDTIAEQGDTLGVYTDARPPYGCLGLSLQEIAWRDSPPTCSTPRRGQPAAGIVSSSSASPKTGATSCAAAITNADGRTDAPLLSGDRLARRHLRARLSRRPTTSAESARRWPIRRFSTTSSSASASSDAAGQLPRAAAALAVRLQHLPGIVMPAARRSSSGAARSRRAPKSPAATTRTFLSPPMRDVHQRLPAVDGSGRHDGHASTPPATCAACIPPPRRRRRGCSSARISTPCPSRRVRRRPRRGAGDRARGALGGRRLPFAIEVVGFSEEEGVRFGVPFIGSRALAGTLDADLLARRDAAGITVRARDPRLRTGPAQLADGPAGRRHASAISSSTSSRDRCSIPRSAARRRGASPARAASLYLSRPGQSCRHDADAPRRDALAGAASGSAGREARAAPRPDWSPRWDASQSQPGAANVVPGTCRASLDVRHADDAVRARRLPRC